MRVVKAFDGEAGFRSGVTASNSRALPSLLSSQVAGRVERNEIPTSSHVIHFIDGQSGLAGIGFY